VEECIGGYARVVSKVKELQETRKDLNPIYLNAGDNFQGTFWYNFFQWNVTSYFLNLLPADAMTIGNHEFDHNIAGIVPFLENSATPIVVCNMDVTNEPTMAGLYEKSMKIQRSGKTIGVIGVILETTYVSPSEMIASSKVLKFLNFNSKLPAQETSSSWTRSSQSQPKRKNLGRKMWT
jgi:5'-nucleotidase